MNPEQNGPSPDAREIAEQNRQAIERLSNELKALRRRLSQLEQEAHGSPDDEPLD